VAAITERIDQPRRPQPVRRVPGNRLATDCQPAYVEAAIDDHIQIEPAARAQLEHPHPALGTIAEYCQVLDTLKLARQAHPGQRNNLDSLCQRYNVDNSHRRLHGALLDAELLADIYLAMTGGQTALLLDSASPLSTSASRAAGTDGVERSNIPLRVLHASQWELELHEQWLDRLDREADNGCQWRRLADREPGADT